MNVTSLAPEQIAAATPLLREPEGTLTETGRSNRLVVADYISEMLDLMGNDYLSMLEACERIGAPRRKSRLTIYLRILRHESTQVRHWRTVESPAAVGEAVNRIVLESWGKIGRLEACHRIARQTGLPFGYIHASWGNRLLTVTSNGRWAAEIRAIS